MSAGPKLGILAQKSAVESHYRFLKLVSRLLLGLEINLRNFSEEKLAFQSTMAQKFALLVLFRLKFDFKGFFKCRNRR